MTQAAVLSALGSTGVSTGFKNRIINGAMGIDQRNSGASVTPTASAYELDRWYWGLPVASKISIQQSTTAPTGFINSAINTVTSAYTPAVGEVFRFLQKVEGFNCSDLGFGTASASTVTLSFWVRNSVTGTYAVSLQNSANNRSYVASYTVNSANTWEQKTITVAGDTSGTWLTNNGSGIQVAFCLQSGSNFQTTTGSWQTGEYYSTSGAATWLQTAGATFYITGVQLEAGTTATNFDFRSYGTELALCQRYYLNGKQDVSIASISGRYVRQLLTTANLRTSPTTTYSYDGSSGAVTAIESNAGSSGLFYSIWCRSDVGTYIDGNVTYTASAEL